MNKQHDEFHINIPTNETPGGAFINGILKTYPFAFAFFVLTEMFEIHVSGSLELVALTVIIGYSTIQSLISRHVWNEYHKKYVAAFNRHNNNGATS